MQTQIDWSAQQFFALDQQLRRLRGQMEEMTWKLDTWERSTGYTNKLRQEVKQGLELIKQNERQFFGVETMKVVSTVKEVPQPVPIKDDKQNTSKESDTDINDLNDENQNSSQQNQGEKGGEVIDMNSSLEIPAVQPASIDPSARAQKEVEILQSTDVNIDNFKFFEKQPFRSVEVDGKEYVEAESVYVAVCLILMDFLYNQEMNKLLQIKNDFLDADLSWVNGNPSLPPEQAKLSGDVCKKIYLQYLDLLQSQPTNDILQQYDIGYILETLIRQYLLNHSNIPQDELKNFKAPIPQIEVLAELAGKDKMLDGVEVVQLDEGSEVTIYIGENQCKVLADKGGASCYIQI